MSTYKVILEYDGTAYAGWQRQPHQRTVQEAFETALREITQTVITTVAAGRTDAGVHAIGQVVSFQSDKPLAPAEWKRALNARLPADISVRSVELVPDTFHARYSAIRKCYAYRILNQPSRPALERLRAWHLPDTLDLEAMRRAAQYLVGQHDFSSFQGHPTDVDNPVCDLKRIDIVAGPISALPDLPEEPQGAVGSLIRMEFEADRFLKQMVRTLVGTLVEVGQGKRRPEEMAGILAAKDRRAAGATAPAHGLYLVRVTY
jgi:tRNA pseudouridine38-40 synthase